VPAVPSPGPSRPRAADSSISPLLPMAARFEGLISIKDWIFSAVWLGQDWASLYLSHLGVIADCWIECFGQSVGSSTVIADSWIESFIQSVSNCSLVACFGCLE
jgi:hypothetical protein